MQLEYFFFTLQKQKFYLYIRQFFSQQISIVQFICLALSINVSFLFFSFSFFIIISKLKKLTKRQIRTYTYIKMHTLRAWKKKKKKKRKKKVKILLALLVQKRAVHNRIGGERKKSSQRLHTCIHRPKTHTFSILLFFVYFKFFLFTMMFT